MQNQASKQDAQLQILQKERDALAAQLEGMRANLDTAASLAEMQVSLYLVLHLHRQCLCLPSKGSVVNIT